MHERTALPCLLAILTAASACDPQTEPLDDPPSNVASLAVVLTVTELDPQGDLSMSGVTSASVRVSEVEAIYASGHVQLLASEPHWLNLLLTGRDARPRAVDVPAGDVVALHITVDDGYLVESGTIVPIGVTSTYSIVLDPPVTVERPCVVGIVAAFDPNASLVRLSEKCQRSVDFSQDLEGTPLPGGTVVKDQFANDFTVRCTNEREGA